MTLMSFPLAVTENITPVWKVEMNTALHWYNKLSILKLKRSELPTAEILVLQWRPFIAWSIIANIL